MREDRAHQAARPASRPSLRLGVLLTAKDLSRPVLSLVAARPISVPRRQNTSIASKNQERHVHLDKSEVAAALCTLIDQQLGRVVT